MNKEEKDMNETGKWEKDIRSKLYDFEAETTPDDWEAIAERLEKGKTVALHPYRKYVYTAAAVAAVLLIVGVLRFIPSDKDGNNLVASVEKNDSIVGNPANTSKKPVEQTEKTLDSFDVNIVDKSDLSAKTSSLSVNKFDENMFADARKKKKNKKSSADTEKRDTVLFPDHPIDLTPLRLEDADSALQKRVEEDRKKYRLEEETKPKEDVFVADASNEIKKNNKRRWGFGMGGGSLVGVGLSGGDMVMDAASANTVFSSPLKVGDDYVFKTQSVILRDGLHDADDVPKNGTVMNNANMSDFKPSKHKTPISVGMGVSYYLNDRWALQSGLVYTLLRSEGEYSHALGETTEVRQYLHYVGIPLNLSYKIAQWKRFRVYASGGGMVEKNFAGKIKRTTTGNEGLSVVEKENISMKELMWSLNARAGVSYPVWKFINVYAEAGCSYYFDNGSSIETIRSSKPFNVSLQAGLSFGF